MMQAHRRMPRKNEEVKAKARRRKANEKTKEKKIRHQTIKKTQRNQEKWGGQEASKRKETLLICNRETIVYLIAVIKQCTESAKYIKCMSTLLHD
jgi:hypothetical protein